MSNKRGITLIALIITIIVLLILAGVSLNALVGENGVLNNARKSSVTHELASMKEDLEMNRAALDAASYEAGHGAADFSIYVTGEDVRTYIPNIPDKYVGKIAIFDGEMVLIGDDTSEEEKSIAASVGIKIMEETDYNYMLEMKYLETAVLAHKDDLAKIGIVLGNATNPYETIAGINYGLGWYKITTESELTSLGITAEQMGYMIHIPYIVKYSTGAVQSIPGKLMYAGTGNEIWKYTFNYKGEEGGLVVNNLLTAVTNDSTKTVSQFGELTQNRTVARNGGTQSVIDNYYIDDYTYDENDGGLILKKTSNILYMPVDQTKPINQKYSLNITVKCNIIEAKQDIFSANDAMTVLAISPKEENYVSRIDFREGLIKIATFFNNVNALRKNEEIEQDGLVIADVSDYSGKYLNIQVTAERGGKTKIYLNGTLFKEINSGNAEIGYDYCCIGDIRPGRGMKFEGNVYNFALYGEILTDEEIAQNWNYVKNELGINEAGDKVN